MLTLSYSVKNTTNEDLKLKIEGYPTEHSVFSKTVDTILIVKPYEKIAIGYVRGIGFPWETKKLFRESRGCQNFWRVVSDSLVEIDHADKNWKYRRGVAQFKLR